MNCLDCEFCRIFSDVEYGERDNGEKRIYCSKKRMSVACLVPFKELREEASVPDWCPLTEEEKGI